MKQILLLKQIKQEQSIAAAMEETRLTIKVI